MPPIISIVGNSDSGKTTLIEKLIPELKKRGYRVGVIKPAHHGFNIDKEGKDSWRHKVAGADTVLVSSPGKIAMVKDEPCGSLDGLHPYFSDLDLVITEGYKREDKPKIEVFRKSVHPAPVCTNNDHLMALVTDSEIDIGVPKFGLEAVESIVDLIESRFLKKG